MIDNTRGIVPLFPTRTMPHAASAFLRKILRLILIQYCIILDKIIKNPKKITSAHRFIWQTLVDMETDMYTTVRG